MMNPEREAPKKIVYRKKITYTETHYRNYSKAKWKWEECSERDSKRKGRTT